MMFKRITVPDNPLGWIASIVLHGLLILLFIFIASSIEPLESSNIWKATEITFASTQESTSEQSDVDLPPINILKRRINEETPLLQIPVRQRPSAAISPVASETDRRITTPQTPKPRADINDGRFDSVTRPTVSAINADSIVRPPGSGTSIVDYGMFSLDFGSGPKREKTSGSIPSFPSGADPGTVRIEIAIDPEGRVISWSTLTRGGDPRLETASIDALRRWRFSRLDGRYPQRDQRGVITFNFEVR
ncbi:MAG: TonB family protein [Candidatus Electryoneaceae bacterium]|nr:TonB family protein [Candidatus Electryoneaceae bacterium]